MIVSNLDIKIIEMNSDIYNTFKNEFKEYKNFEVINTKLQDYKEKYDCIVSPANSFGLMDGGFDLAIINVFGEQLMKRVQKYIIDNFRGLQPVGTSFLINAYEDERNIYLAHTPTMIIPMDIQGSIHPYLAMRSTLLEIIRHNESNVNSQIKTILFPVFGGKCGMMNPLAIAKQMRLAYNHINKGLSNIDWMVANEVFKEIIMCNR